MIEHLADADVSLLLRGESGVGKEAIARELHRRSPRSHKPFVKVSCAALPAALIESELFGSEQGAFTGTESARAGRFEFARTGTILLDRICELPLHLQARLLHVLRDRSFTRIGRDQQVTVNVRILAATSRDLEGMLRDGRFRRDLYYGLQVIEITVPPLRVRQDEIVPLAKCLIRHYAGAYHRPVVEPSLRLSNAMRACEWPGNIRQLENMMKRLVVLQHEGLVLEELRRHGSARHPVVSGGGLPLPPRHPSMTP